MRRALITAAIVAAGIALVAVAAVVALPSVLDTATMRSRIANAAAQALGRPVQFTSISITLIPRPALRLNAVEIGEDPVFGATPFLTLDQLDVRLHLGPLLRGHLVLDSVVLRQPHITVIQHADGQLSVASLGATQAATPAAMEPGGGVAAVVVLRGARVQITDGVVLYFSAAADGSTSHYWIEDLNVTLIGHAPFAFEGTGRLQPGNLAVKLSDGTIALDGASSLGDAPLRARLALEAAEVADLATSIVGPKPAIGAGVKATLAVAGTLAMITASGEIAFSDVSITHTRLQCPAPKERRLLFPTLTVDAVWENGQFVGRPATAAFGDGTIATNLIARVDTSRVELMDIAATAIPLEAVLVDFFCTGYAVTGPLDLTGVLSFGSTGVTSFGEVRIGPGKVVGEQALVSLATMVRVGGAVSALLSADLPWSLFSSPLDFDSLTGSYRIANGVLTMRDLVYESSAMRISGTGEYVLATGQITFDLVVNHGRGQAYVTVTGTADAPITHVTPSTILREVHPGKIGRGLQDLFNRLR